MTVPGAGGAAFDLVVIGSGPAGEKGAALAAYHGKRVAVIERAPRLGGAMVDGVVATKTMREAAVYLTGFRQRAVYGVGLDVGRQLAVQGVRQRSAEVEDLLADSVRENLKRHGIEVLHGSARLLAPGHVAVTAPDGGATQVLRSDVVLLAPGTRPLHPAGMPFDHRDVLDSDTARALDRPVRSLVVIGGGAVACEFASVFAALGSDVTLVESRGRLLPFVDAEIGALLAEAFVEMDVRVMLGAGHAAVTADADGAVVGLEDGTVLYPSKVIVAAGRVGNTEELGLVQAGVATDAHGHVVVDEHFATTAPGVYAAGDVTGPPALASVAMEQGRVAMCHAFGIPLRATVASAPIGVYTIPEVASVGLAEDVARADGLDVEVGRARLSRNARNAISGAPRGLVKLVFDRGDHRLLGAHVIGDHATELVHQAQAVLELGGTIDYFVNATFNTPTASEAFKYAAYDGLSRLEHRHTLTVNA